MCEGTVQLKWVLIKKLAELTGYTEKAIEMKIAEGMFVEGLHYRRAPDGRLHVNLQGLLPLGRGRLGRDVALSA